VHKQKFIYLDIFFFIIISFHQRAGKNEAILYIFFIAPKRKNLYTKKKSSLNGRSIYIHPRAHNPRHYVFRFIHSAGKEIYEKRNGQFFALASPVARALGESNIKYRVMSSHKAEGMA
jgi:hypothetical protein